MNNNLIELKEGQILAVNGRAGVGKTRRAVGDYGYYELYANKKNVMVYSDETPSEEIDSIMVAKHIFIVYGVVINDITVTRALKEPSSVSEEELKIIMQARDDLFCHKKYGRIHANISVINYINILKDIKENADLEILIVDNARTLEDESMSYDEFVTELKELITMEDRICILTNIIQESAIVQEITDDSAILKMDYTEMIESIGDNLDKRRIYFMTSKPEYSNGFSIKDYSVKLGCSVWEYEKDSEGM